jgi:hypothetical protein
MNSIGPRRGRAFAAIQRTLGEVFSNVEAFALVPDGEITNVFFIASDGPLELPWVFEDEVAPRRMSFPGGTVLTDQLNPVNHWNAPFAREIRRTRRERYRR